MKIKRCGIKVLFLLLLMLSFSLAACESKNTRNVRQSTALDSGEDADVLSVVAVVTAVDDSQKLLTLQDTVTKEEQTFSYNGATEVYSRNDVDLVMTQLNCGDIVEATYSGEQKLVTKVQISKDAWEYESVQAANIERTENRITVTGCTYAYDQQVPVFCGDKKQMLLDISDCDEVSIRGIGDQVYSFVVTTSHGFVRLAGHEAFIGGSLEVDQQIFETVEQNMLLTLGEGEHTVVLEKDGLEAVENVTVEKDKEVLLDLSQYVKPAQTEGKVKFIVTPSTASLYINGKLQAVNKIISLPFGNYKVNVCADGYEEYSGVLRVQKSQSQCQKIYVELVEDKTSSVTASPTVTAGTTTVQSAVPQNTNTATVTAGPTATSVLDAERTMTVKGPAGASVYLDGVYKGVAPVTLTKKTGELTITLSKEGYVSRSYNVTVEDKEEDVEYSFAELVKE